MLETSHWKKFVSSWNDLRLDPFMADGGKSRYRRYSEFRANVEKEGLALLPHVPYRQSKDINYLNGDIDRLFEPIDNDTVNNPAFAKVVLSTIRLFPQSEQAGDWLVQIFQNRIVAVPQEAGKPTPEGIHRDGVDFVLSMLTDRKNINGGESAVYLANSKQPHHRVTLANSGEFILLNDNKTKHSVTPIECADPSDAGHRDMLIAMYTRMKT